MTYAPLPHELTDPLAEPPPPPQHCNLAAAPAWCVDDVLAWIDDWRAVVATANRDRASAARISAAAAAQAQDLKATQHQVQGIGVQRQGPSR